MGEYRDFGLTYGVSFTLSGQALHRYDPTCTTTHWSDLLMLIFGEQLDQEEDLGAIGEWAHQPSSSHYGSLIIGIEEGWDMETQY